MGNIEGDLCSLCQHKPDVTINRRSRRYLNSLMKEPRNTPLKITDWKTVTKKITVDKKGVPHHSHSHTFSIGSGTPSTSCAHTHSYPDYHTATSENSCSYGICSTDPHSHSLTGCVGYSTASTGGVSHTHTFSGTTSVESATDLNHTHSVSVTSSSSMTHKHGTNVCAILNATCYYGYSHTHTLAIGNAGGHTHTLSGNTGTGTGTLQSHTHSINLTSGATAANHRHVTAPQSTNCGVGSDFRHNHWVADHPYSYTDYTVTPSHTHSVSGDTALGGEPPGWTGKISGVSSPAKVMGIPVANIAKVKGVA